MVGRWLAAGWEVAADLIEEAAESRATERSQLRDPPSIEQFRALIKRLPDKEQRAYGRWLWKICDTEDPETLHGTLESMFMGRHFAHLPDGSELLDGLGDLVKWRMHFNDYDPSYD